LLLSIPIGRLISPIVEVEVILPRFAQNSFFFRTFEEIDWFCSRLIEKVHGVGLGAVSIDIFLLVIEVVICDRIHCIGNLLVEKRILSDGA